jgi:hypothetical protein
LISVHQNDLKINKKLFKKIKLLKTQFTGRFQTIYKNGKLARKNNQSKQVYDKNSPPSSDSLTWSAKLQ